MNDLNLNRLGFEIPSKELNINEIFFKDKYNIIHGRVNNDEIIRWLSSGVCCTHPDKYNLVKIHKQTIYVKDNSEGFYPKRKLKVSWTKDMNNHLEETGWKKVSKEELLNLIDNDV